MPKNNILILILLSLCMLFLLPACKKEVTTTEKTGVFNRYNSNASIQVKLDETDEFVELKSSILFDEHGNSLYYGNLPPNIAATIYYENDIPVKVVFDMAAWAAMHPTGPC